MPNSTEQLIGFILKTVYYLEDSGSQLCRLWLKKKKITSLVAQTVKNLPIMQETRVLSLSQRPLEEGMATHSSILA